MAWFSGRGDFSALSATASRGSVDDFLAVYHRRDATMELSGTTLLGLAMSNDPGPRVDIATRLLDDGADVTRCTP